MQLKNEKLRFSIPHIAILLIYRAEFAICCRNLALNLFSDLGDKIAEQMNNIGMGRKASKLDELVLESSFCGFGRQSKFGAKLERVASSRERMSRRTALHCKDRPIALRPQQST